MHVIAGSERGFHLVQFLLNLIDNLALVAPVKTVLRDAFLNLLRLKKRGTVVRDAVQNGLAVLLLLLFHPLPETENFGRGFHVFRTENMRVPADHLLRDLMNDIMECKRAALLRNDRLQSNVHQQIAHLLAHPAVVFRLNGIHQFGALLHQAFLEGLVRLLAIPRAAVGCAQTAHNREKVIHCFRFVFSTHLNCSFLDSSSSQRA